MQNYPNPFNPSTTIKYNLSEKSNISLVIFNALGQQIKTLVNETQFAGEKQVVWKGLNQIGNKVSSGIYFYRLTTHNKVFTKKMHSIKLHTIKIFCASDIKNKYYVTRSVV